MLLTNSPYCSLYRVSIDRSDKVTVVILGLSAGLDAPELEEPASAYDSIHDLPEWMKHRLAALYTCDPNKNPTPTIKGVGRRIDEHTFWILKNV